MMESALDGPARDEGAQAAGHAQPTRQLQGKEEQALASQEPAAKPSLEIIFLTITFDPEPGAQHGLPLAKEMIRRGHKVKVLTTFPQYPLGRIYDGYKQSLWAWESIEGVPVLRVPIYPSHDMSGLRRAVTYLSFMASAALVGVPLIGRADVVFLYEPPPTNGIVSALLRLFRGTPIIHHIADMWPDTVIASGMVRGRATKWLLTKVLGAYCRLLYRVATFVTVLSPGFKTILTRRGVPQDKVRVIYNWADEAKFRPVEADPALGARLGLQGRFNVLYAGNIGPLQNLSAVVEAAALLKDCPGLQIVIVGTGPLETEVKQRARVLRLDNVLFIPRIDYAEMPKVYSLADVLLVHLRDYDFLHATIPSKTQVSLASGKPVLIGAVGDAAALVRQSGAGVVCRPDDPAALAEGMRSLFLKPRAELEEMGRRGRRFYLDNLSLEKSANVMEQLFVEASAPRRRK